jgi:RNase adapter protein RapZ
MSDPEPKAEERVRVVVVTGLSGAGKSTALHALEDLGFYCVDNLPTALAPRAVEACEAGEIRRIALGIDVRVGSFLEGAAAALDQLEQDRRREVGVLFLDASDEALLRRFSETRRPHPLSKLTPDRARHGAVAVLDGVQIEREQLSPLRARATLVIDTTLLSVHDLRRQVIAHLGPGKAEQPRMVTRIISFGFKYGVPVDADVVLDVRLLDNPFFVKELRHLPGTDPAVQEFVKGQPDSLEFIRLIEELLVFSLPRYEREGKSYLTIAVGCTGGRHRSVVVTATLAEHLRQKTGLPIVVLHRDVGRADMLGTRPRPALVLGGPEGEEK